MRSKVNNNKEVAGEGLLTDIFLKPFIPKKKVSVEKLDNNVSLYATMCMESYKQKKADFVVGQYNKDSSFNEQNCVVYASFDTVVLAIRGTDPKNSKDIFTDIMLALNKLKYTKRYSEIKNIFKQVTNKYQHIGKSLVPYKYIVTGHSLGGSLALQLLVDNPKIIESIHIFNAGSSPADIKKGLTMKLGSFLGIGFYKTISRKINIYRVTGDLISLASRFLNGNYYDIPSSSFDRHGMNNFQPKQSRIENIQPSKLPNVVIPEHKTDVMREETIKPTLRAIKPNEEVVETEQKPEEVEGTGINKKKIISQGTNKMDVDTMKMKDMVCYIRSNKKVKNSMAGFSKLNQAQLREALKKYLEEGIVKQRVVKETDWSKALKVFNKDKETFIIPKKGTADYEKVKSIMKNGGVSPVHEPEEVVPTVPRRQPDRKKKRQAF